MDNKPFECSYCGTIFIATRNHYRRYNIMGSNKWIRYESTCPHCGRTVTSVESKSSEDTTLE